MDFSLQSRAWADLVSCLDRLPHALLLHGVPGVGKLALAERFAQLLLCEKRGSRTEPCGACEGCRWFQSGSHPDVRFLEPEALARQEAAPEEEGAEEERAKRSKQPSIVIRIEQVRALAGFINVGSHRAGRRVVIVHPAEDMNANAANALLKSLEEPPAGAFFLLVSNRPSRLLPTIRSRCVPVPVPLPDAAASAAWLAQKGVRAPERWIAFAGGAPRRALEYATGERGAAVENALRAAASGDRSRLAEVKGREDLESLAEVLQKVALDRAFASLVGRAKYGRSGPAADSAGDARAWLTFARAMGRHRALVQHPLNPRLFAADMVAQMPGNQE